MAWNIRVATVNARRSLPEIGEKKLLHFLKKGRHRLKVTANFNH
jgi:hypothetical protein